MIKQLRIMIIAMLLLAMMGCRIATQDNTLTEEMLHQGTDGVTVDFTDGMPPDTITESTPFYVMLDIHNSGAHNIPQDITQGIVTLSIEEDYMKLADGEASRILAKEGEFMGKNLGNIEGERQLQQFKIEAGYIDNKSEEHESLIIANVCYYYETNAGFDVCIDTDPYKMKDMPKACEMKDVSSSGQGGPVAVTSVEIQVMPDYEAKVYDAVFTIYIDNVGGGMIIDKDSVEKMCTAQKLDKGMFNVLAVDASLGELPLDCGDGVVRISKEYETYIRCSLKGQQMDTQVKGAYTSKLKVNLRYGYTNSMSKKVTIKRIRN